MNYSEDTGLSFFSVLGVIVSLMFCGVLLCIPGCLVSEHRADAIRAETIDELCNKNNGGYDFCELKTTTYHYIEKGENDARKD